MAISSISLPGLSSLRDSVVGEQEAASQVAQAGESDGKSGIIEALLQLQQAKLEARLAARVVKAGDQMVGTVIDTFA